MAERAQHRRRARPTSGASPFERGLAAFPERFWNEQRGHLADVVDVDHAPGTRDDAFRPNQIFAVGGLPFALLAGDRARRVVDAVEARLLTPLGLRTLPPGHPDYHRATWGFLPPDVYAYSIAPPRFTCWFPFLSSGWNTLRPSVPGWLPVAFPPDHHTAEPTVGLLTAAPFTVLALVALAVGLGRARFRRLAGDASRVGDAVRSMTRMNWLWAALINGCRALRPS